MTLQTALATLVNYPSCSSYFFIGKLCDLFLEKIDESAFALKNSQYLKGGSGFDGWWFWFDLRDGIDDWGWGGLRLRRTLGIEKLVDVIS